MPETADALAELARATPAGRARAEALRALPGEARGETSLVAYSSAGRLLIIGPEDQAVAVAQRLQDRLRCTVLAPQPAGASIELDRRSEGVRVVRARLRALRGSLGRFQPIAVTAKGETNLAEHLGEGIDLVLDLTTPRQVAAEVPPLGYYAPGKDPQALAEVLGALPDMVGEFEKPKFFRYDPDICAHGASGLTGCTRCLDACPTKAIASIGEKVEVDPYLCQGAGACVAVCPTGAMSYTYPSGEVLQSAVRGLLKAYRETGGTNACLLFHDRERGRQVIARIASRMPERVIPLEVEEIGSIGMEIWLSALAYGADQVALLAPAAVAGSVTYELRTQIDHTGAILEGMGYARDRLQLIAARDGSGTDVLEALEALTLEPERPPAAFAPLGEKRRTIRLAVDHLYAQAPAPVPVAPLPEGASFGEIKVNREACTLCMACVGVCPTHALADGGDLPQLIFYEDNCVQCGLCETACPEDAITRWPRYAYDRRLRQDARVLNEEKVFCCVRCGKPFATQKLMDRMAEKLKGHWMFQKPGALERLQMCEDCRVKDLFASEGGIFDVHRRT